MNILAQIWNVWAPKDVIVNAAQRVGISSTGLDVRKMQQDKFGQAAKCMDTESSQAPLCTPKKALRSSFSTVVSPLTPNSLSNTARKKFQYGSSKYWQFMYEQPQGNIQNCYEKSLKLNDIPGLLTINKVKPTELKKINLCDNVHGLMEGLDILARVEVVQKEKEKKKEEAESRK